MPERDRRGEVLVAIAREAIVEPQNEPSWARPGEPWLAEDGASFVTLRLAGELRGCIGTIEPVRPLGEDVQRNAYAAAYRDPRFPPVSELERHALDVEVSVLSPMERVAVETERDAIHALRPGIDGVLLEFDGRRATFLPQVWESIVDPLQFLSELRLKANLPARFWHPKVHLSRYTVEKFT
jgi:AmmeMemoRadiSam system protein A